MAQETDAARRDRLSRDRVLSASVALADAAGIESLSMRKLAVELGVVPMALYKHVANKEELLDGMVDIVVGEIEPSASGAGWRTAVRQRILSARRALLRHAWAARVIESRTTPTPVVLAYLDSMVGMFRAGGFSDDLTHHVMHALGSSIFGFARELYAGAGSVDPGARAAALDGLSGPYPHIAAIAPATTIRNGQSSVDAGCDDQFEFEFALDLLLDGFERLRRRGWSSADQVRTRRP